MYKDNSHSGHLKHQGGLESVVELAIGAKVIITTNLDTDIDIANGARGHIEGIWADPCKESESTDAVQDMMYPPSCVQVKFEQYRGPQIEELGDSTIPFFPFNKHLKSL